MRIFCLRVAGIGWLLLVAVSAYAQSTPAFEELLRLAETSAPRLIENAAEVRAAQGRTKQAAAIPNPQLGLEVENISGTSPYRGSTQAQTTLSLSEPLEIAGQRSARVQASRADLAFYTARSLQLQADFGHDVALAYANAEVAQARAGLLTEDLSRSDEDLRVARALVKSGKEADLRVIQAEAALAATQADLEAARASQVASLANLSSLVGAATAFTSIGPSVLNRELATPGIELDMPAAPAVVAAQAAREAADRRVRVEQKRVLPVVSLSVGLRRFKGEDATAMVGGLSLSVPLFDWNRGAIAASRAEREAADARLAAAKFDADAAWRSTRFQIAAVNARVIAAERAESAAREAYRLARIGYEAGRTPLIELLATRRGSTEAQIRSLDARFARVQVEASLARLTGRVPFAE